MWQVPTLRYVAYTLRLQGFVSNVMTLLHGDVIATGTPSGIGPMKPGGVVEVRIEKRNYVVEQASRIK